MLTDSESFTPGYYAQFKMAFLVSKINITQVGQTNMHVDFGLDVFVFATPPLANFPIFIHPQN